MMAGLRNLLHRLRPATEEAETDEITAWVTTLQRLCNYDPTELAGQPIGMLHCPECGCMILAGCPHPLCDPNECELADDAT